MIISIQKYLIHLTLSLVVGAMLSWQLQLFLSTYARSSRHTVQTDDHGEHVALVGRSIVQLPTRRLERNNTVMDNRKAEPEIRLPGEAIVFEMKNCLSYLK